MPKITQDTIELIKRKIREDELIKKHYEREKKAYSKKIKQQTLEIFHEYGRISLPLLVRKFKITFKAAKRLKEWALKQPLQKRIRKKEKKQMDREELKKFLREAGAPEELLKNNLDEIIKKSRHEETEKNIKIFEHTEGMILSIFKHLNMERHACLQILIRLVANQTADFPEKYLDAYLNFIKMQWKINASMKGI